MNRDPDCGRVVNADDITRNVTRYGLGHDLILGVDHGKGRHINHYGRAVRVLSSDDERAGYVALFMNGVQVTNVVTEGAEGLIEASAKAVWRLPTDALLYHDRLRWTDFGLRHTLIFDRSVE